MTIQVFCIRCGKENSDDAVYCQKCGARFENEEETRIAARSGLDPSAADDEPRKIFSVSPTLMFVKVGYALAVVGAFVLVAIFSIFFPSVAIWPAVILGMALLLIPAFYHLRQKMVCYTLTEASIEIDSGFISRTTQNIPLRRIQDVTVATTVTQRLLGFGDLVMDNASEDGGKIVVKNIDSPRKHADMVLRQIRLLER